MLKFSTPAPLVRASVSAVLGGAVLLASASTALAAEAEEADDELAEVQVTGTRILVPGNYTSANPMTTITGDEMRQLGLVNVADALTQLVPQNISSYTPDLIGDDAGIDRGSYFIGNTIANLRGLDPEFGSRTLTLIDGRRVPSTSNQADVVDMNIIPSNLLQRMDVVTGGASATYGSGAMAGVVNLVLNNRLTGINADVDYGFNEAGDGASPHVSLSGGLPLMGGRAHALLGVEWQDSSAIRDCAAARNWCAESRSLFTNSGGSTSDASALLVPLEGFEGYPTRFQMANVRYSQFAPTGTIYSSSSLNTSGFRFLNPDENGLIGGEEYAYGTRGGTGRSTMNGDGPLLTSGTAMRPSTERRTAFANFEYNFTERTTGYVQGSYAKTDSLNRNRYTQGDYCVRFDAPGVSEIPGGTAAAGQVLLYGGGGATSYDYDTGELITQPTRDPLFNNGNFRTFMGASSGSVWTGGSVPYWISAANFAAYGATSTTPPTITFANGTATYRHVRNNNPVSGTEYWLLWTLQVNADFNDPGTPAILPATGGDSYAFIRDLAPEALNAVQAAFNNRTTSGTIAGQESTLWGANPCRGYTAIRKVWNPQVQQYTTQESETFRTVAGIRGRFGRDWRWEAYYQYGQTDSTSRQYNVATNLRLSLAMDSVIDDRVDSPTYDQPICRITRDGIPLLDWEGRPLSDPAGLAALAEGCTPINVFGTIFATPEAAEMQQQAIDYAFRDTLSSGGNSLSTLSFTSSGTLWGGIGAGPLTGAFGFEVREDKVDNQGTQGAFYERADFARTWADAFGGRTRVTEGYTELNMPLISGVPGINLWSVNAALRYASYNNKGGAGTTGESATQGTTNWKFSTVFEPFDWVRFRLTRSRDLRAAGYRDLFINDPGIPDETSGLNYWRERTPDSSENQQERFGTVRVGNADLSPEKSDTLTLGLVLSPGGWAQGMRLSFDYYDIKVKDGITRSFGSTNPILACWEGSGNIAQGYFEDGTADPDRLGVNGLINDDLQACKDITFGTNEDGSRNLNDIVYYNVGRPQNSLPYQRRGLDMAWNYRFPLSRAFESVPGTLSLTMRGTRTLESSGIRVTQAAFTNDFSNPETATVYTYYDLVGQIRTSVFIPGVSASPKWSGNIIASYLIGDLSLSLSTRYVGGAKIDKDYGDSPDDPNYQDENGNFLNGSIDNNSVKKYFNFALNGSYNLDVGDMKQFQVFGSINNLFNKSPPFTGGGVSGASAQYHDIMGRAYRFGVRMRF